MPRGGKREGAGRKPGSLNRISRQAQASALAGGVTPLDYMLGMLRDPTLERELRFEAAKAAAPYVHPRLAQVHHQGEVTHFVANLPVVARDMTEWWSLPGIPPAQQ